MKFGWHFWLTFLGMVIIGVLIFWLVDSVTMWAPPVKYFVAIAETWVILFALHGWNESKQAIDPQMLRIYGSWQNFAIDSRRDWREFAIGSMVGFFFYWIIVLWVL